MINKNHNGHFGINGIDIHPASDTDADLITVDVTPAPKIKWDNSETSFSINAGFIIQPATDSVTAVQVLDADQGIPVLNVDTVNERVGVGEAAPTGTLHIVNVEDNANVTIFNLEGKRPTPANNDTMYVYYRMYNDTPASFEYARTTITAEDITTDEEEGSLLFEVSRAGTLEVCQKISATEIVLNEAGADRDFRVEAVGQINALVVQGSDGNVGIGNAAPTSKLMVDGSSDEIQCIVQAHSTQTANLQEWQDSSANILAGVDERGVPFAHMNTSVTNVFIGGDAGRAATTGTYLVGVGYNALNDVTSGIRNIAIGSYALSKNTDGQENIAVGYEAMAKITSGEDNIAIGTGALSDATTQDSQIAIGDQALGSGVGGIHNVAIGKNALLVAYAAAGRNIAIGSSALQNTTTGNRNIALGASSGITITTGANNVLIGSGANVSVNSISSSIAFGRDATVTKSNQLVLGSASYPITEILFTGADNDITLVFSATTNSGTLIYYEDEDDFYFDTNVRVASAWHGYGGFEDQAETITCGVGDWNHITNAGNNLWNLDEGDGVTLSSDVFTLTNTGDYAGTLSVSISGLTGKDFHIRVYNNTQTRVEGRAIGISTTGANNEMNVCVPIYIEGTASDAFQFEIMSADGSDPPTVDDALFYMTYLHD
jgi:hypothetical protein